MTSIPERFDVSVCDIQQINAVEAEFDADSGNALGIGRINFSYKKMEDLSLEDRFAYSYNIF